MNVTIEYKLISNEITGGRNVIVSENTWQALQGYILKMELNANEKITKLRKALKEAAEDVTAEYCSHANASCGADNPRCYGQEFYKVLKETE